MIIWSSGNNRTTYDNGKYQFFTDGKLRLEVTVEGNNSVINLIGHGTINSNGDLRINLDKNQESSPTAAKLKIFNGSGHEVFSVSENGDTDLNSTSILTRTVPLEGGTGNDYIIHVGTGLPLSGRGRVVIRNQPKYDDPEFSLPKKAGILVLYDENGWENFLWVDTNGKLRISRSDPGANDLAGVVIGTQV